VSNPVPGGPLSCRV